MYKSYDNPFFQIEFILEKIKEGFVIADKNFTFLAFNEVFLKLYGNIPAEQLLNKTAFDIYPNFTKSVFYETIEYTKKTGIPSTNLGFSHNTQKWIYIRCFKLDLDLYIMFISPVVEHSVKNSLLNNIDPLTSLPNRFAYENDILNLKNYTSNLSFILIDIKRFNIINQNFDFSTGDFCLMEIAARIKQSIDLNDKIYRISSDQFLVITNCLQTDFSKKIQNIQQQFNFPFNLGNQEYFLSIYIGIYHHQAFLNNSINGLVYADLALKYAKKNQLSLVEYSEFLHKKNNLLAIEKEIRFAFENEEFEIYLQPQIDIINGKVCGAEALIRWNHPTKGLLTPNYFLHDLEELNYSEQLDSFVFFKVQEYIQKYSINIPISINLNGKNIVNKDFQTKILESNLQHIGFEITESNLLDIHKSTDFFNEIRKLKSFLSIDDFGTGYCSLEYLLHYSVDYLKIEKKFISYIDSNKKNQSIVTNIIKLGHSLNCAIIAEGVERKEELDFLKNHQCDIIQGYYYSKPLPIQEFLNYFLTKGISFFKSYIQ